MTFQCQEIQVESFVSVKKLTSFFKNDSVSKELRIVSAFTVSTEATSTQFGAPHSVLWMKVRTLNYKSLTQNIY